MSKHFRLLLPLAPLALAACHDDESADRPEVQVLHASLDAPAVNVIVDGAEPLTPLSALPAIRSKFRRKPGYAHDFDWPHLAQLFSHHDLHGRRGGTCGLAGPGCCLASRSHRGSELDTRRGITSGPLDFPSWAVVRHIMKWKGGSR
jgi:hypothetical protein